jgi:AcrR family transcriptional regulator
VSDDLENGRRERVLAAALATFARYGYRKTSMEDVARAADISRPGLYFLFTSKEQLFRAAVTQALDDDLAAAQRSLDDTGRPLRDRLVEAFDAWTGRYIGPMAKDVAILMDTNPDLLGRIVVDYPERFAAMVTAAIASEAPPIAATATAANATQAPPITAASATEAPPITAASATEAPPITAANAADAPPITAADAAANATDAPPIAAAVTAAVATGAPAKSSSAADDVARTMLSTCRGLKHEVAGREQFVERMTTAVELLLTALRHS